MRLYTSLAWLVILILLFSPLACKTITIGEISEDFDIPTAAPNAAPPEDTPVVYTPQAPAVEPEVEPAVEPQVEADPTSTEAEIPLAPTVLPPVYPLTIQSPGMRTSYGSSVDASCVVQQQATLTVHEDGTAELATTGAVFVDHYNCTPGEGQETWVVNGTADLATETVTFASCNFGGFDAAGSMTYSNGVLYGEVTCFTKNGEKSFSLLASG